jgi:hypothetical protein
VTGFTGRIVIEWPARRSGAGPHGCLKGPLVAVFDGVTGEQIMTASRLVVVNVDAEGIITADVTMFADADGQPVFDGDPHEEDGEVLMGTFPFLVTGMRIREAS